MDRKCHLPDALPDRGLFGVRKSGDLELYFNYWDPEKYKDLSEAQVQLNDQFQSKLIQLGFAKLIGKKGFPIVKPEEWLPKTELIVEAVAQLASYGFSNAEPANT